MSNSLRKIEYYGIRFWDCGEEYEDSEKLFELIESLNNSYIYDDEKQINFGDQIEKVSKEMYLS